MKIQTLSSHLPYPLIRYALLAVWLLLSSVASAQTPPKVKSQEDSLIRVWTKLQKETYFSGQYDESVLYFDSLLEQQGVRIDYFAYRMGIYCAKKSELKRNYSFGEKVFGKQLLSEKWHSVSINTNPKLYEKATSAPLPTGGMKRFKRYLYKNLTYPREAISARIEGTVQLQFVVNRDGSIGGIAIVKGLSKECNMEAQRLIRNSSPWHPAFNQDIAVYYKMILDVEFKLPKKAVQKLLKSQLN